jgi:hypothetical protein
MKTDFDEGKIIESIAYLLHQGLEVGYTEEDGDEYRLSGAFVVGGFYRGHFDSIPAAAEGLYNRWNADREFLD